MSRVADTRGRGGQNVRGRESGCSVKARLADFPSRKSAAVSFAIRPLSGAVESAPGGRSNQKSWHAICKMVVQQAATKKWTSVRDVR